MCSFGFDSDSGELWHAGSGSRFGRPLMAKVEGLAKIALLAGGSIELARKAVKEYADRRGGIGQFDKAPDAWVSMFMQMPQALQIQFINEVGSK